MQRVHAKYISQAPEIVSLKMMETRRGLRSVAVAFLILLLLLSISLVYVPWQQSVTGYGRVIVFSPMERPQSIEAQIPGRIRRWNVVEGQTVKAGEVIVEIQDIDSKFLLGDQVRRLEEQRQFMETGLTQSTAREIALGDQLKDIANSRNAAIPAAEQRLRQAEDRQRVAEQNVEQAKQSVITAELNLRRIDELFRKGLRSKRDLELAELEIVTAKTRLESNLASLEVARRDLEVARLDRERVINDTSAQVNGLRAAVASVRETIAKTNSDLQKLGIDIGNVTERNDQRLVRAPRDGKVVRVMQVGEGETVKAGDQLALLAPLTTDQAVELYLSDYDAPLVAVGRAVRLNFAGWPALQFVGWPSVAVGTFAGRVKVIDAVDDGKNRFRIIVVPDEEAIKSGRDEPWPKLDQLRPGAEVNGWVLLDVVSIGFELWRQFNAFPPTVSRGPIGEKPKVEFDDGKQKGKSKDDEEKDDK
ncbi:MAG: HlyD family secretion protein [Acidobacteriota bacterium]